MPRLARPLCALLLATALVPAATTAEAHDPLVAGALAATDVTVSSATLTGTASGEKNTTWWVEYGSSLADASHTEPASLPGGKRPVTVSASLTGLRAGTRVYARLVVAHKQERENGAITSFVTAAPPVAPTPPGGAPGAPAPSATPRFGDTVVAAPTAGSVRVRAPGSRAFVALTGATEVAVGSVVDAHRGTLALTVALPGGAMQHATFRGGRFAVRQYPAARGFTDLHLRGRLRGCGHPRRAAAAAERPRKRRLWGKDAGGRFRTHGRDSVTTVRGTEWTVTDRCDGTLTRVEEGAVDVRVRRTGRVVHLEAGERHLARHRR